MRSPGLNETLERLFRNHPIRFPLILALLGWGMLGWMIFGMNTTGFFWVYAVGLAVILGVAGLILLPIGIITVLRRRMNPVVLRCQQCGVESRTASAPFRIEHFPGVDYAYVVCSQCGADFTVNKYANLV